MQVVGWASHVRWRSAWADAGLALERMRLEGMTEQTKPEVKTVDTFEGE